MPDRIHSKNMFTVRQIRLASNYFATCLTSMHAAHSAAWKSANVKLRDRLRFFTHVAGLGLHGTPPATNYSTNEWTTQIVSGASPA